MLPGAGCALSVSVMPERASAQKQTGAGVDAAAASMAPTASTTSVPFRSTIRTSRGTR